MEHHMPQEISELLSIEDEDFNSAMDYIADEIWNVL
jgi:hypothetical protein